MQLIKKHDQSGQESIFLVMAATRKLQAEIDRCLKKVAEGVEKFEDTWQKVHNASNANQKEKYEEDLKKEIKKLQRLRDQIKTWLASGEIKDKSTLMDNRKLIETQMERFKIVERETKTKAYSKEGLTSAARMDPAERERAEMSQWLNHCIETLNIQSDQFEAEIELLQVAGTGKRKKASKEDTAKQEECQSWLDKHRDHIQKLETLLRMLDNCTVDVNQVKDIKDDVDDYIENCQEPDFVENEYIFDDIDGLEEMLLDLGAPEHNSVEASETASSTNSVSGNSPVPGQTANSTHNHSSVFNETSNSLPSHAEDLKRRHRSSQSDDSKSVKKGSTSSPGLVAPPSPLPLQGKVSSTPTKSAVNAGFSLSQSPNNCSPSSGALLAGLSMPVGLSMPAGLSMSAGLSMPNNYIGQQPNFAAAAAQQNGEWGQNGHPSTLVEGSREGSGSGSPAPDRGVAAPSLSPTHSMGSTGFSKLTNSQSQNVIGGPTSTSSPTGSLPMPLGTPVSSADLGVLGGPPGLPAPGSYPHPSNTQQQSNIGPTSQPSNQVNGTIGIQAIGSGKQTLPESLSSLKSLAQQATQAAGLEVPGQSNNHNSQSGYLGGLTSLISPSSGYLGGLAGLVALDKDIAGLGVQRPPAGMKTEAHIPPLLGVAPLGPVPLSKENQFQYSMLEAASHHLPHPSDSERLRPYLPRNPCGTPHYYPQTPPPGSDTIEFFQRLSTETLFFIFYYMEGTKAQYLAAKALKKQSWRFHTKYMMWFQRHEEPKMINDEYEQGTYIYFDYEKWGQRKKEGFTFEYRFLEDRDLN